MPTTNWYTWPTESDFDAWHGQVVEALNLPRIGNNAATGEPNPTAQATIAYTAVTELAENDWRAPVESHIADQFTNNLGTPSEPPAPYPDDGNLYTWDENTLTWVEVEQ